MIQMFFGSVASQVFSKVTDGMVQEKRRGLSVPRSLAVPLGPDGERPRHLCHCVPRQQVPSLSDLCATSLLIASQSSSRIVTSHPVLFLR